MGKSTAATMFRELGVPVWDADAAVHRLYAPGGAAVEPMQALRPDAIEAKGVSRDRLKEWIAVDPTALRQIEAVVHPLVAADRAAFVAEAPGDLVVLDIPLLFETGSEDQFDTIVVVSAPPDIQRARVLARPGMTEAQFDLILSRQMPDAEKRRRADVVVPTVTMEETRAHIEALVERLRHA
jgi:dephospho-CoA kinase